MSAGSKTSTRGIPPKAKQFFLHRLQEIKRFLRKKISIQLVAVIVLVTLMPYILRYLNPSKIESIHYTDDGKLDIQKLITEVKSELYETEQARIKKGEASLFKLEDFDLEISFVVRANSKQGGSVTYQVVTVDSEIQTGLERVQKLKLHMKAIPPPEEQLPASSTHLSGPPPDKIEIDRPFTKKGERP